MPNKKIETAKLELTHDPVNSEKASLCHFKDQASQWIPKYYIVGYNPATKIIEIETYVLIQKGVHFKL